MSEDAGDVERLVVSAIENAQRALDALTESQTVLAAEVERIRRVLLEERIPSLQQRVTVLEKRNGTAVTKGDGPSRAEIYGVLITVITVAGTIAVALIGGR